MDKRTNINSILKSYYGYDNFRKDQEEIISTILSKKDTICIMPTGGGKSLCYQIPAIIFDGITVVISPLISLMKDQVDTLNNIGISATYLNSTLSQSEQQLIMAELLNGVYKLVYIAPERLQTSGFLSMLQQLSIKLVAVDEAHCISQWGHDFRPSYSVIGEMLTNLNPRPVVAAFTATATEQVINDIQCGLKLKEPATYNSGYERNNLSFSVVKTGNKRSFLLDYVQRNKSESGIIYCSTVKDVEVLQTFLQKNNVETVIYHGKMNEQMRSKNQESFLFEYQKIMIATNAFGMGINKPNVRYVLHYQIPKSIEAYYQEAGRAGRDGEQSECILLFSGKDVQTQKYLIQQSQLDESIRDHEYKKLQFMVDYCHTTQCLQNYIIHYFGDPTNHRCNRCTNCLEDNEVVDITIDAQKIFSCVIRMKERFGATLIAQVLKGSNNRRVKQLHLTSLSTYGIMQEKTEKEINELIQLLCAEGYLAVVGGQYPTIKVTSKAIEVLKNNEKVSRKVKKVKKIDHSSSELFERLRALRKALAEAERLPPYIIFSDVSLKEMCHYLPTTKLEMLAIKGVGERKFELYGAVFMEEIHQYVKSLNGDVTVNKS